MEGNDVDTVNLLGDPTVLFAMLRMSCRIAIIGARSRKLLSLRASRQGRANVSCFVTGFILSTREMSGDLAEADCVRISLIWSPAPSGDESKEDLWAFFLL